jgi:glycosyltransferase involved in cell wall biosynthesis
VKIAFVYDVIYPYVIGGVQKRIWEIAIGLAGKGHDITVFGAKHWAGDDVIFKDGVRLWGVCPPISLFDGERRSIKEAISYAWKLLTPLLKERYDIVDCQNFPYFTCFSAKLHSILKKSKLVITWHEVWDNYWYEYLGWKGVFGWLVERVVTTLSKYHIAVSEATRQSLRAIKRMDIELIPNGIDIDQIAKIPGSDIQYHIVTACRLIKDKNIDLLLRVVSLLRASMPDVKCLIIGDGPEREKLEKLVAELDLIRNVKFTGFLKSSDQVFSYFKSSSVFVLPSTREGFGMVVLEANACGLPVVTVAHPMNSARYLITEGKNGLICQFNTCDMAAKIRMALSVAPALSGGCIEYANRYDWNEIVDEAERTYRYFLK